MLIRYHDKYQQQYVKWWNLGSFNIDLISPLTSHTPFHPSGDSTGLSPEVETSKWRIREGFGLQSNRIHPKKTNAYRVVIMHSNHLKSSNLKWYVMVCQCIRYIWILIRNKTFYNTLTWIWKTSQKWWHNDKCKTKPPGSTAFDKPSLNMNDRQRV